MRSSVCFRLSTPARDGGQRIPSRVYPRRDIFLPRSPELSKNLKRSAQTGREGARLTRLLLFSKGRVFFLAVQSFQKSKAFDRATAQIRHNNGTNKPIVGCITFVFENSCRCIFLLERGIEPFHVRSLCLRINTAISIYTALHSTEHIRHTSTSVIPADRLARHAEP